MSSSQIPTDSVLRRHYEQHMNSMGSARTPGASPPAAARPSAAPARSKGLLGSLIDKLMGRS